jgi:LmbE family N-acetylglucosaminyl deacetylase|tara:strand:+ start:651 stop:1226 length:576 start_codon:yes stop_codon:yes gene_type:complete
MTPELLAATREREQQEASDVMGAANVVFLSYPDGGLEDTILFRSQVVRAIRMYKPDIIMAIDPYRSISHTHRDHRMSGQVAVDSAFTYAWNERHFPEQITKEGLEPHRVTEVYLWGSEDPNVFVDVSEYLQMKADSLTKHASQMRGPVEGRLERVTNGASRSGERAGIPYAEGFRRIRFEIGSRDWQYLSC